MIQDKESPLKTHPHQSCLELQEPPPSPNLPWVQHSHSLRRAQHPLGLSSARSGCFNPLWTCSAPPSHLIARGCSLRATELMSLAGHQRGKRSHIREGDEVSGSAPLCMGLRMERSQAPTYPGAGLASRGCFTHPPQGLTHTRGLTLNQLDFYSPTEVLLSPSTQLGFSPAFLLMDNH